MDELAVAAFVRRRELWLAAFGGSDSLSGGLWDPLLEAEAAGVSLLTKDGRGLPQYQKDHYGRVELKSRFSVFWYGVSDYTLKKSRHSSGSPHLRR